MNRYLEMCKIKPDLWKGFINKEVFRNGKSIGVISEVTGLGNDRTLVIGNGERKIFTKWIREGNYYINNLEIDEESKNIVKKEIKEIETKLIKLLDTEKLNIDNNIEPLVEELNFLEQKRVKLLDEFITLLNKNYFSKKDRLYENKCWRCGDKINSLKNEFCIYCGWYKCSYCRSCGCNAPYSSGILIRYREFLRLNIKGNRIKKEIESVNGKITRISDKVKYLERENYSNKILKEQNNKLLKEYNEKIRELKSLINDSK